MRMNGRQVYRCGTRILGKALKQAILQAGLTVDDSDLFIPHQANRRIIESAARYVGLPEYKVLINIDRYGITSAASIPIALTEALEQGRAKSGDTPTFVAGLTLAASIVKLGERTAPQRWTRSGFNVWPSWAVAWAVPSAPCPDRSGLGPGPSSRSNDHSKSFIAIQFRITISRPNFLLVNSSSFSTRKTRASAASPSNTPRGSSMVAPVWKVKLTNFLARGLKVAIFPLYMKVGAPHLISSSILESAFNMASRISAHKSLKGLSAIAIHSSTFGFLVTTNTSHSKEAP